MIIVLVGPPGSGKSTLAPLLADALGVRAHDLDRALELAAGRSIAELFAVEGEAGFRSRERTMLLELLAAGPGVLAVGAGCVLDPANRDALRAAGRVVHLATAPRTQLARLQADAQRSARPLLADAGDLLARLEALHAERLPLYRAVAGIEIATDALVPAALAAALLARLGTPGAAGR